MKNEHAPLYIYIYIYIYIYNAKRESMKDYKHFFCQYSEFHVFTRQSSVENCYQRTNYNIIVSNKIDVILIWYHYIVIRTLVSIFNWWLSSKDMKLWVLTKEVLVVFHWLTFRIISCVNVWEIWICYSLHFFIRYTTYHFLHWK